VQNWHNLQKFCPSACLIVAWGREKMKGVYLTVQKQTYDMRAADQQKTSFSAWMESFKSGPDTISKIVGIVSDDYAKIFNRIGSKKHKGLPITCEERQELRKAEDIFHMAARHNKILLYLEQTEKTFINLLVKPNRKEWGSKDWGRLVQLVAALAYIDGYRPTVQLIDPLAAAVVVAALRQPR
jgi:hypothetical protein